MLKLSVFSGRYLFLNAIANQLRYPNSHTHYFSCVLLYLFAEANTEAIQEQITRYVRWNVCTYSTHCIVVIILYKASIRLNPKINVLYPHLDRAPSLTNCTFCFWHNIIGCLTFTAMNRNDVLSTRLCNNTKIPS